jgi:hypothetical protein
MQPGGQGEKRLGLALDDRPHVGQLVGDAFLLQRLRYLGHVLAHAGGLGAQGDDGQLHDRHGSFRNRFCRLKKKKITEEGKGRKVKRLYSCSLS